MENTLSAEELEELLNESFEHLREGRFRMALISSKRVFKFRQGDYRAAIAVAWSYLENGYPNEALEYADLAVKLGSEYFVPHLYRGFILMRLGIFEGALTDLDFAIENKCESLDWAYHLKARSLAGLGKYYEALEAFELSHKIGKSSDPNFGKIKEWFKNAAGIKSGFLSKFRSKNTGILFEAEEAFNLNEYWYTLWVINNILSDKKKSGLHQKAKVLQIETMFALFQFKPCFNKAEQLKEELKDNPRFREVYNNLIAVLNRPEIPSEEPEEDEEFTIFENVRKENFEIYYRDEELIEETVEESEAVPVEEVEEVYTPIVEEPEQKVDKKAVTLTRRTDFFPIPKVTIPPIFARTFDLIRDLKTGGDRRYLRQFDESNIRYIGVEIVLSNPYYKKDTVKLTGTAVWLLNEEEVGRNNFELVFDKEWEHIVFVQSWGMDEAGFWVQGQGKVDIHFAGEKICEKWFLIGSSEIVDTEEPDIETEVKDFSKTEERVDVKPTEEGETKSLQSLLDELNGFIGLSSVKQAMKDFVLYLEFIKERKRMGLKTAEGISIHSVFSGSPGTGKTTVARLLGEIFKAMGLLEKGHVVEVDRAALVGQYVGETAQKTEKVIADAIGGVLFIDEAYTLYKKGGSGQDFGQEAIDTLLKRMEDKAGEFAVIAAGYTDDMNDFLASNAGLKSRFSHFFSFEDYTPEELIEIFKLMAKKEDYKLNTDAVELLKKEFTNLYRKRDKTFGNARMVKNILNDAKIQLGKRYLKLPEKLRDKKLLTTIGVEDITAVLASGITKNYQLKIDEEALKTALDKLNSLMGLKLVKQEINQMVKLARYYSEKGESLQGKFADHVIAIGNPGTGKTTVARLFSQILAALGFLPKGQLIEADRQSLVASYVGKTAEKTTEIINQALGGTLFIDEAYTLIKQGDSGSDFGKEAVDTLLKRMEDDRGKFVIIAAGYTDDMNNFLDSNVGLKSRFTRTIVFEDYTPEELMMITDNLLKDKKLELEQDARQKLLKHYNELYRTRDKTFGNARLVRNIVDTVARNQLLRLVDIPQAERTDELTRKIVVDDFKHIFPSKSDKKTVKVEGDKELLDQHLKELYELTGLDSVKQSVEKLIKGIKVAKLREERGLKVIPKNLHSVFLGNPGTGKTTVARLISKIYKEMGLLEKGHLVEIDRAGLVAGYVGQTAKKTDEVIEQALGGTLFIDEAYTLSRGGSDFGQEAIDTVLKRMEDYRDKLVIIVAGYTDEMKDFLESNPGLQSRFTNYFTFEDYTPRQMLEIASIMSEKNGYKLDEGALQLFLEIFGELYNHRDKNFGNARTVRNILYKAINNQEERILTLHNLSDEDLTTITYEDVQKISMNESEL
ncbi:MAG TPA: AAA family ATPase [Ignavibacteriaceae bacterium]|jgi:SpoVK/Ycf46/Vps4 family AAA+-type ATPase/tetratricopeptide (TPR) repeat protein|nr:AAA family ATPase [Ignavibacteriaceae bacterium]